MRVVCTGNRQDSVISRIYVHAAEARQGLVQALSAALLAQFIRVLELAVRIVPVSKFLLRSRNHGPCGHRSVEMWIFSIKGLSLGR